MEERIRAECSGKSARSGKSKAEKSDSAGKALADHLPVVLTIQCPFDHNGLNMVVERNVAKADSVWKKDTAPLFTAS